MLVGVKWEGILEFFRRCVIYVGLCIPHCLIEIYVYDRDNIETGLQIAA